MEIVTSLNTRVLVTASHFDTFLPSSSTFLPYGKQTYKVTTQFVPVRAHVHHLSNKRPPKNQTVMSVQHYGRANVWGGSDISTNEPRVPKLRIVIIHMQFFFYFGTTAPSGPGPAHL